MKNLELSAYGVDEMKEMEVKKINGGGFWVVLGVAAGVYAAILYAAEYIGYEQGRQDALNGLPKAI